jgi:hypothetical protein
LAAYGSGISLKSQSSGIHRKRKRSSTNINLSSLKALSDEKQAKFNLKVEKVQKSVRKSFKGRTLRFRALQKQHTSSVELTKSIANV